MVDTESGCFPPEHVSHFTAPGCDASPVAQSEQMVSVSPDFLPAPHGRDNKAGPLLRSHFAVVEADGDGHGRVAEVACEAQQDSAAPVHTKRDI